MKRVSELTEEELEDYYIPKKDWEERIALAEMPDDELVTLSILNKQWSVKMSMVLSKFAESFVNERLTADKFADAYMELWNIEGDLGLASQDKGTLSQVNSTIFLMADLYNPDSDRDDYEFDEEKLRLNVKQQLEKLKDEGYFINFIEL